MARIDSNVNGVLLLDPIRKGRENGRIRASLMDDEHEPEFYATTGAVVPLDDIPLSFACQMARLPDGRWVTTCHAGGNTVETVSEDAPLLVELMHSFRQKRAREDRAG